jgi:hypothetical protein
MCTHNKLFSIGGHTLDDCSASEELGIRLAEAEKMLKLAEEQCEQYVEQLEVYKKVIIKHKQEIMFIKGRMNLNLQ